MHNRGAKDHDAAQFSMSTRDPVVFGLHCDAILLALQVWRRVAVVSVFWCDRKALPSLFKSLVSYRPPSHDNKRNPIRSYLEDVSPVLSLVVQTLVQDLDDLKKVLARGERVESSLARGRFWFSRESPCFPPTQG